MCMKVVFGRCYRSNVASSFDQKLSVGVSDQKLSVGVFRSIDVGRCCSTKYFGSFFDQMLLVDVVSRPQFSLCTYGANGGG